MRAQVSIEFLAMIAFGMLITLPLLGYLFLTTNYNEYYVGLSRAERSMNELKVDIDSLSSLPGNNSLYLNIILPDFAKSIEFRGNYLILHLDYHGLRNDIVKKVKVPVNGNVNFDTGGAFRLKLSNNGGGVYVEKI